MSALDELNGLADNIMAALKARGVTVPADTVTSIVNSCLEELQSAVEDEIANAEAALPGWLKPYVEAITPVLDAQIASNRAALEAASAAWIKEKLNA